MLLFNRTFEELQEDLKALGEPAFRAKQIWKWVYQRNAASFESMTDLSKSLREQLPQRYSLALPPVIARQVDEADQTEKILMRLADGETVEAVRIPRFRERVSTNPQTGQVDEADQSKLEGYTACLSTQVGCQYACQFCASGQGGLTRNLTAGEIVAQLLHFQRAGTPISRIVFMGSGEPLHNFEPLRQAIAIFTHPQGLGLSSRRITISTVGLVPEIYRLAKEEWKVKLAVSLHATTDARREHLIPLARGYQLDQLMDALRFYQTGQGRRISFEYLMLNEVNDEAKDAERLVELTKGLTCHVNLIPFNAIPRGRYQPSPPQRIESFRSRLRKKGIDATVRYSRGRNIDAACGQLRQRVEEEAAQGGTVSGGAVSE